MKKLTCPMCGVGTLLKGGNAFVCTHAPDLEHICQFRLYKTYFDHTLTDDEVEALITTGATDIISGLKKKDGTPFSAALALNKETGGVSPKMEDRFLESACPRCGGRVKIISKGYACEKYFVEKDAEKCPVFIATTIAGRTIDPAEAEELLRDKKTDILDGFTSSAGKDFMARLVLTEDGKVEFDSNICACPKCGQGNIRGGGKTYYCSNYKGDDKCEFFIWKQINGKNVTPGMVTELCSNRSTKVMKGFKTKEGQAIERALAIMPDWSVKAI
ncbi:MAG: topoisomerase C-terminal repeat-containing protein [Tannerella sp.]|jgi:DNA topoisomerase-3|nr:topoisomerase C-terminal repeat-containing protein [Tannerella sp.]